MNDTIVFTGGGTGGHIFPGLAVAEYVRAHHDGPVVWIGSGSAMERGIVERWGLPFHAVPSGKLRRYFSLRNVLDVFVIAAGIAASVHLLRKLRPAVVFSKGGFVSVPPVLAARLLGIPVFTHESDRDPGLATKINARFADTVFVSYEETGRFFPENLRSRVDVSGNPVRSEIFSGRRDRGRAYLGVPDGLPVVLVLGGSQGSLEINALIRKSGPQLCSKYFVVHQTGEGTGRNAGQDFSHQNYRSVQFMKDEFPDVLAAADLVICRSGAGTIWENAASGKPSILLPLEGSGTRGDQVLNARLFRDLGASVVLEGEDKTETRLLQTVEALFGDPERLEAMGKASAGIGMRNASEHIGRKILEKVRGR